MEFYVSLLPRTRETTPSGSTKTRSCTPPFLGRGGHIAHRLSEGRGAWLHIVHGEVTLGEVVLGTGDGVGVTAERVVSMTAREETEILLVDLDFEATEPLAIEGSTEIATALVSGTSSPVPKKRNDVMKKFQLCLLGAAFGAALLLAPTQASAANCNFSKKEKTAMVSWIMLIPGAVITGLACKHDLFTKKGKSEAMLPAEGRDLTQTRFVDRRRRNAI